MSWHLQLSRGLSTVVDDADRDLVSGYTWYAQTGGPKFYAATKLRSEGVARLLLMHRLLLAAPDGLEVDHIDRDTLNNRRANLRLANHSQNQANAPLRRTNTSGYRGVSLASGGTKWRATLKGPDGHQRFLGRFASIEEAAMAYDVAALERYGAFAQLNFP